MKYFNKIIILILMVFLGAQYSFSQVVAPTGISTRASSQLVFFYDEFDNSESAIQVTNSNDTTSVWIHVQIFRNYDPDGSGTAPPVFCDERNFVDFLTPNDTHVYFLDQENFNKNEGEDEITPGEETTIDLEVPSETKGFVVITPVVSEADLSAISFQYLFGTAMDDQDEWRYNAMGRDAVDFSTGEIVATGTPLDGTTNGYVVLQPEELLFNFAGGTVPEFDVDIIGIAYTDNYGPPGLLGYQVTPAVANWTSFIFDFKEDPTSCGNTTVNCFYTSGLNDTFEQNNDIFTQGLDDALLCDGAETPQYADGNTNANFDDDYDYFGWTRIFVTGLGDFDNHIGIIYNDNIHGRDYMFVRGERTEFDTEPPVEDCAVEGDEDEDGFADCLDTDCATDEACETGEEECADEMDNDEDGDTDCADLGCDGFAGCEFGEEVSCDDGIDNDADGAVDGDDTDCQAEDTGGGDGDGGGCTIASAVTASTAAANFLLPLLPLAGAYGYRRLRRRNSK